VDFLVMAREQAKASTSTNLSRRAREITRFLESKRVKLYENHGTWQMTVNGALEQGFIVHPSLRSESVTLYNPYAAGGVSGGVVPGASLNASARAWQPPGEEIDVAPVEGPSVTPPLPAAAQPSRACAFFLSDQGCRYGAQCKNAHDEAQRRETRNAVRGRDMLRAKRRSVDYPMPMPPRITEFVVPALAEVDAQVTSMTTAMAAIALEFTPAASLPRNTSMSMPAVATGVQRFGDLDPAMVGMGGKDDQWGMVEEFEHRTCNRNMGVEDNRQGEITSLVFAREAARYQRRFTQADELKQQLKKLGVRLDDKEKMWHSNDGTSGFIPPYALLDLSADTNHFNPYY
jgi:hypothetical protein